MLEVERRGVRLGVEHKLTMAATLGFRGEALQQGEADTVSAPTLQDGHTTNAHQFSAKYQAAGGNDLIVSVESGGMNAARRVSVIFIELNFSGNTLLTHKHGIAYLRKRAAALDPINDGHVERKLRFNLRGIVGIVGLHICQ